MRVYFKFLNNGELPIIWSDDRTVLTVEDGQVHYNESSMVCAIEKTYYERHTWSKHYLDLAHEIEQWCDDPKISTLREEIRVPLMQDARSMRMRTTLIFIRCYYASKVSYHNYLINFTAGILGFNGLILSDPHIKGPSVEFETESFIDSIIDGASISKSMTRYGITPRGRIINPLPPICDECGIYHHGHTHQTDFSQ